MNSQSLKIVENSEKKIEENDKCQAIIITPTRELATQVFKVANELCKFNKIKGTIILAEEGINGTIAGLFESIKKFESHLLGLGFAKYNPKYSYSKFMPFSRLKVRNKKEIVT